MQDDVFIVGGGPSLKDFDFGRLENKEVIAVNKGLINCPFARYFVTIDFSFLRKIDKSVVSRSRATKVFIANYSLPYLQYKDGRIIDTRFDLTYDLSNFDMIINSYRAKGIGKEYRDFRSGINSGFCGLQLAILLGYTKIYLLGFDLKVKGGETHYHGGYGEKECLFAEKLKLYYEHFKIGLSEMKYSMPKIEVFSCSRESSLNGLIPYIDIDKVAKRRKICPIRI